MSVASEWWLERFNAAMERRGDPLRVVEVDGDLLYRVGSTWHLTFGSYLWSLRESPWPLREWEMGKVVCECWNE
jgi:hypothetical protein